MRLAVLIILGLTLALSNPASAAEVRDHPAVTAYPESVATRREDDGFRSYNFVIGVNEKGATDDDILQALTVEGNVTRLFYENPKDRSPDEIFANYREGLEKAGFEIFFACATSRPNLRKADKTSTSRSWSRSSATRSKWSK